MLHEGDVMVVYQREDQGVQVGGRPSMPRSSRGETNAFPLGLLGLALRTQPSSPPWSTILSAKAATCIDTAALCLMVRAGGRSCSSACTGGLSAGLEAMRDVDHAGSINDGALFSSLMQEGESASSLRQAMCSTCCIWVEPRSQLPFAGGRASSPAPTETYALLCRGGAPASESHQPESSRRRCIAKSSCAVAQGCGSGEPVNEYPKKVRGLLGGFRRGDAGTPPTCGQLVLVPLP